MLAFFLPGWLLARRWGQPCPALLAFPFSLVLLYAVALTFLLLGLPLRHTPVLLALAALAAAAAWGPVPPRPAAAAPRAGWLLLPALGIVLALGWRAWLMPLSCADTFWRWDFLARLLLAEGHLNFYPPASAAQFAVYPYPDPIPPGVAVMYWMLYSVLGQPWPAATALVVVAQYLVCLLGARELAARYYGPGGADVAALALASSSLFYRSLIIGQETGLTALSVVAFLLALPGPRPAALAMSLALGGIAREYGPAFLFLAAFAGRQKPRYYLELLGVWALLVLPWYARTWWLTGNPLLAEPLGGLFPANPVVVAGRASLSHQWRAAAAQPATWWGYLMALLKGAPVLLGLGALGFWRSRGRPRVLPAAIMLAFALYLASIPATASGGEWAQRVLTPALAGLAVLAGACHALPLARLAGGLGCLAALPYCLLYPTPPASLPLKHWPGAAAFSGEPFPQGTRQLRQALLADGPPVGSRVLTFNANLMPLLRGTPLGVVMGWSPELFWLYDPSLPPEKVRQRLLESGIRYVVIAAGSEEAFVTALPFFNPDLPRWELLVRDRGYSLYRLPLPVTPQGGL